VVRSRSLATVPGRAPLQRAAERRDLVLEFETRRGKVRGVSFPTGTEATAALLTPLAECWLRHPSTYEQAKLQRVAAQNFSNYVSGIGGNVRFDWGDVTTLILNAWERNLARTYGDASVVPFNCARSLLALIKQAESDGLLVLSPSLRARLDFPPLSSSKPVGVEPLTEFSARERLHIRQVTRRSIDECTARIRRNRSLAQTGPIEDWPSLLGSALNGELTVQGLYDRFATSQTALYSAQLPIALRNHVQVQARGRIDTKDLVLSAYAAVYPLWYESTSLFIDVLSSEELVPESLRNLRAKDLMWSGDKSSVSVCWVKDRAAEKFSRVYDESAVHQRRFVRGLRLADEWSRPARSALGEDTLWVAAKHATTQRRATPGLHLTDLGLYPRSMANWLEHFAMMTPASLPASYQMAFPAIQPPFDVRRLRKTTVGKAAAADPNSYFLKPGVHSRTTFFSHYSAQTRKVGEFSANAIETAQRGIVAAATRVTVIPAESEAEFEVAGRGLDELDDSGVSTCIDIERSPFSSAGARCTFSRTTTCLSCPNAIFAKRHLPAVVHIQQLASEAVPDGKDFERWGSIANACHEILLSFTADDVETARTLPSIPLRAGQTPTQRPR
jgi:hypothetical protein